MVTLRRRKAYCASIFWSAGLVLATLLTSLTEELTESFKGGSLILAPLGQGKYGGEQPHDGMRLRLLPSSHLHRAEAERGLLGLIWLSLLCNYVQGWTWLLSSSHLKASPQICPETCFSWVPKPSCVDDGLTIRTS